MAEPEQVPPEVLRVMGLDENLVILVTDEHRAREAESRARSPKGSIITTAVGHAVLDVFRAKYPVLLPSLQATMKQL